MRTIFRNCFLVNFAVDPTILKALLPYPIVPQLHAGCAFVSIVIADMQKMRPAFLPPFFGITYNQVVYRAVVSCGGERGVHFLRSDADNALMCLLGNAMTFFHFNYSRVTQKKTGQRLEFDLLAARGHHADIHATFDLRQPSRVLPASSRFDSLAAAQEFLVELYAAFASDSRQVSTVRIERGAWEICVVEDLRQVYEFMDGSEAFPRGSAALDSVFYVADLPYYWSTLEKHAVAA